MKLYFTFFSVSSIIKRFSLFTSRQTSSFILSSDAKSPVAFNAERNFALSIVC